MQHMTFPMLRRLAAAVLLLAAAAPGASAQEPPSPKILVIDMQEIMRSSTAVQAIQKQIETRREAYQEELRKREEELRGKDQELSRQRSILAPDTFAQKRKELEEQLAVFQRDVSQKKQALEKSVASGMRQVESKLIEIADAIAGERGANLVLPKSSVVLVHKDFEITGEALKRLNSAIPSLTLPKE